MSTPAVNKPVYLTAEGIKRLEAELNRLLTVKRPEVAHYLEVAREAGEIQDDSAYEDAVNELALLEGQIREIRSKLNNAVLIQHRGVTDLVELGSFITVREEGEDEPVRYQMVSSTEADPLEGRISDESPIGRALMGQPVNAVVSYKAPDGEIRLTILKIE